MTTSLADLSSTSISPDLWYRIHVFLFDLQHYTERADSKKKRLEEAEVSPSYIGPPYFNGREATASRDAQINGRTVSRILKVGLDERLQRRNAKRVSSGDYLICAAHDLAPILGGALGADLKQLAKDKRFQRLLDTHGLCLGVHWKGLPAKSFARKNRKRRG